MEEKQFVPALGFHWATPLYQTIVDLFCRDDHIKSLVAEKIQNEGRDMQILDIACGPGKLVKKLAQKQHCCNIVGSDIDSEMVKKAQEKTKDIENVTIVQADCTNLGFEADRFDIVVESLLFHHLSDLQKKKAIEEISRVLKKNGIFYFVDWIKPSNVYAKAAFNIVKIVDGKDNTESHENNTVIKMIEEKMKMIEDITSIETTFGTIAIIRFQNIKQ